VANYLLLILSIIFANVINYYADVISGDSDSIYTSFGFLVIILVVGYFLNKRAITFTLVSVSFLLAALANLALSWKGMPASINEPTNNSSTTSHNDRAAAQDGTEKCYLDGFIDSVGLTGVLDTNDPQRLGLIGSLGDDARCVYQVDLGDCVVKFIKRVDAAKSMSYNISNRDILSSYDTVGQLLHYALRAGLANEIGSMADYGSDLRVEYTATNTGLLSSPKFSNYNIPTYFPALKEACSFASISDDEFKAELSKQASHNDNDAKGRGEPSQGSGGQLSTPNENIGSKDSEAEQLEQARKRQADEEERKKKEELASVGKEIQGNENAYIGGNSTSKDNEVSNNETSFEAPAEHENYVGDFSGADVIKLSKFIIDHVIEFPDWDDAGFEKKWSKYLSSSLISTILKGGEIARRNGINLYDGEIFTGTQGLTCAKFIDGKIIESDKKKKIVSVTIGLDGDVDPPYRCRERDKVVLKFVQESNKWKVDDIMSKPSIKTIFSNPNKYGIR
jgi:hypothetical protein